MKKIIFILIFVITCPFFIFGCSAEEQLNFYNIVVNYDDEMHIADCYEQVTYINNSNNVLETISFHLYPNAFRENATSSVVSLASFDKAFPNGKSFGKIDIQEVKIGDKIVDFTISGRDENILEIPLSTKIYPQENVIIDIDFLLTLPNINHRFGYGENTINFGNFYPIACVYEENDGFSTDCYISNGDPFYSDVSNYKVIVSYNNNFQIASSGEKIITTSNERKTTTIEGNKIRDFCFVLSDKFSILTANIESTTINYYYYIDENPEKSLQIAVDAVKTFNSLFGEYPYSQLSVVETNFVHGGMEYPNLVMISDVISDHIDYEYVIVHEIAHQWWYGVVGNNEYDDAWLDESLTEYSTALFYDKNTGYGLNYDNIIKNATEIYKTFLEVYRKVYTDVDTSMCRALDEYKTEPEYINCVYTKGVIMFDTIREQIGERRFYRALQIYFKEYAYKNVKEEDLISSFEKASNRNMEGIFDSWVQGKVIIL